MINPDRLNLERPTWPTGHLTGSERRLSARDDTVAPRELKPIVVMDGVAVIKVAPAMLFAGVAVAGDLVGFGWADQGVVASPFAVVAESQCVILVVHPHARQTLEETLVEAVGSTRLKATAEHFSRMAETVVPYGESRPSRRISAHQYALALAEGDSGVTCSVTGEQLAAATGMSVRTLRNTPYRALLDTMRVVAVARATSRP